MGYLLLETVLKITFDQKIFLGPWPFTTFVFQRSGFVAGTANPGADFHCQGKYDIQRKKFAKRSIEQQAGLRGKVVIALPVKHHYRKPLCDLKPEGSITHFHRFTMQFPAPATKGCQIVLIGPGHPIGWNGMRASKKSASSRNVFFGYPFIFGNDFRSGQQIMDEEYI
jgi:hypothetical protein